MTDAVDCELLVVPFDQHQQPASSVHSSIGLVCNTFQEEADPSCPSLFSLTKPGVLALRKRIESIESAEKWVACLSAVFLPAAFFEGAASLG
jgi:PhoPQ-activated pathogenicity-related protein